MPEEIYNATMNESLIIEKESFLSLQDKVITPGLCTRCGMCVGICPHAALTVDTNAYPALIGECTSCGFCSAACPGGDVDYTMLSRQVFDESYDTTSLQGHVEQLYVCHPNDQRIRNSGASGGMVTGILDYLLANRKIDGAVVVGMDDQLPYKTKGMLATSSDELLSCAQSKYCVTPSLAVLQQLRKRKGEFAVVALPCQVHALRKMQRIDRSLASKIKYILGLYCHCTMAVNGHEEAIEAFGIPLQDVAAFQFRGGGWPGGFFVIKKDGSAVPLHEKILIKDVMNVMFRLYGPKRCLLCIDALCEYADLSFGDFWAFDFAEDLSIHERCTLISQRTEIGRQLMADVQNSGEFVVHTLPHSRNSKRILRMARGKKSRAYVGLHAAMKRGKPYPSYHFKIPMPTKKEKRSASLFLAFQRIKSPILRKIILKLLFSPIGHFAYMMNSIRKKTFIDYHA